MVVALSIGDVLSCYLPVNQADILLDEWSQCWYTCEVWLNLGNVQWFEYLALRCLIKLTRRVGDSWAWAFSSAVADYMLLWLDYVLLNWSKFFRWISSLRLVFASWSRPVWWWIWGSHLSLEVLQRKRLICSVTSSVLLGNWLWRRSLRRNQWLVEV